MTNITGSTYQKCCCFTGHQAKLALEMHNLGPGEYNKVLKGLKKISIESEIELIKYLIFFLFHINVTV